jgi:D-glycero-alpha-D-manno-heptose-7-phosphate kinase
MGKQRVEATAPCRVDLAGGPLDVWPIYLFHPGAVTVDVAIDRRAWCRVETGVEGVHLESKDSLQKLSAATVSELLASERSSLVAQVLRGLGVESGIKVETQLRVPAESGLGGPAALAVAVAGAVSGALGRAVDPDQLWALVRDAETSSSLAPTGSRDAHAAVRGGVLAVHLDPAEVRVEALAVDPARVEESLLLIDGGAAGASGGLGWEALKGQIEGDARVQDALDTLGRAARGVRDALVAGRFEDVGDLLAEEWEARKRLVPGITTPEIDQIVEVARGAGGSAKPCGAGRVVAVWAPPGARGRGRREAVEEALRAAGLRTFRARVDLRGLEVG